MDAATRNYRALGTLLAFLVGLMLFNGCTSLRNEVDPSQLGLAAPKLVVTCFLSPQDTILAVRVTRSNTVVGDSISLLQTGNNVTDATVTLSSGGRTVKLLYDTHPSSVTTTQLYYSASAKLLPIVVGQSYTLTVITANGQRAGSTCTIPAPVPLNSITVDSLDDKQDRFRFRNYFAYAHWQDPVGQPNYYQVAGNFRSTPQCSTCPANPPNNSAVIPNDDNRGLLSDVGLDGKMMVSGRVQIAFVELRDVSLYTKYKTASVTLNLMSVDQSYYRYQEAIIRQRRSRNNPFAEPVLIPSNIDGGLGCFAGYNNAILTKTLK